MKTLTSFTALVALALPVSAFAQQSAAEEAMDAAAAAVEKALADIDANARHVTGDISLPVYLEPVETHHVQIDYPPESFLAGEEGDVSFRVDVGADSKPTGCTVTVPSEFARLNEATCPLVLKWAMFRAGIDDNGSPLSGTIDDHIYWEAQKPEVDTFAVRFAFTQTPSGEEVDCEVISFTGTAPKDMKPDDMCRGFSSSRGLYRDENGVPVSKRVEIMIGATVSDPVGTKQNGE